MTTVNFLGGLSFPWPKQPKWPKWIFWVCLFLMTKATKVTKVNFLGVSFFDDQRNQSCLSFHQDSYKSTVLKLGGWNFACDLYSSWQVSRAIRGRPPWLQRPSAEMHYFRCQKIKEGRIFDPVSWLKPKVAQRPEAVNWKIVICSLRLRWRNRNTSEWTPSHTNTCRIECLLFCREYLQNWIPAKTNTCRI